MREIKYKKRTLIITKDIINGYRLTVNDYFKPLWRKVVLAIVTTFLLFGSGMGILHNQYQGMSHKVSAAGTTYYVDATSGNDINNGLSAGAAWKTLAKVQNFTFSPGDTVLFKRGEIWQGGTQLTLYIDSGTAGNPVTVDAYGSGPKPIIDGSIDLNSGWTQYAGDVWQHTGVTKDIGNLILNVNGTKSFGNKKYTLQDVVNGVDSDFYADLSSTLYVHSSGGDPATVWTNGIKGCQKGHGISAHSVSYITYRNLAFQYQGSHGFQANNADHIILENCDFKYMGGDFLNPATDSTRFGNGIELYETNSDITIRNNTVDNAFDECITAQGYNPAVASNYYIYNNVVTNCRAGISAYYHGNPSTVSNIYIFNNIIYNSSGGWSNSTNVIGGFVLGGFEYTIPTNCYFENNIIMNSQYYHLYWKYPLKLTGWVSDYNIYYPDWSQGFRYNHSPSTYVNLAAWKTYMNTQTGFAQEAHTKTLDPKFVNPAAGDFHLQPGSPAVDAGLLIPGLNDTFNGAAPDIGAYESSYIPGDVNSDGHVTITDLSILAAHWGNTGMNLSQGDFNNDGQVNISDLSILAAHWGT